MLLLLIYLSLPHHTGSQCMEFPKIKHLKPDSGIVLPAKLWTEMKIGCEDGYQVMGSKTMYCVTEDEMTYSWAAGKLYPVCVDKSWTVFEVYSGEIPGFYPKTSIVQYKINEHSIPPDNCTLSFSVIVQPNEFKTSATLTLLYRYANRAMTDGALYYYHLSSFQDTESAQCPVCYDFSVPKNRITDVVTYNLTNTPHVAYYGGMAGRDRCFHQRRDLDKMMRSSDSHKLSLVFNPSCAQSNGIQLDSHITTAYRVLEDDSPELQCTTAPAIENIALKKVQSQLPLLLGVPLEILCESGSTLVGANIAYCKGSDNEFYFPEGKPRCEQTTNLQSANFVDFSEESNTGGARDKGSPTSRKRPKSKEGTGKHKTGLEYAIDKSHGWIRQHFPNRKDNSKGKISTAWTFVIILSIANLGMGAFLAYLLHKKKGQAGSDLSETLRLLDSADQNISDHEVVLYESSHHSTEPGGSTSVNEERRLSPVVQKRPAPPRSRGTKSIRRAPPPPTKQGSSSSVDRQTLL